MDTNWSLGLNILLLMVVLFSIARLVKNRRQRLEMIMPTVKEVPENKDMDEDIIAIRKISPDCTPIVESFQANTEPAPLRQTSHTVSAQKTFSERAQPSMASAKPENPKNLMMFLLARENRLFAGYELLQTLLAAGLRFGESQLFHRHQFGNGQGPILCSLAAATPSGLFDLQNIGAFSVRGLCLFMEASGNNKIDEERFTIMLDTARQLAEGLDALLLDDMRRPLTDQRISRYYEILQLQTIS